MVQENSVGTRCGTGIRHRHPGVYHDCFAPPTLRVPNVPTSSVFGAWSTQKRVRTVLTLCYASSTGIVCVWDSMMMDASRPHASWQITHHTPVTTTIRTSTVTVTYCTRQGTRSATVISNPDHSKAATTTTITRTVLLLLLLLHYYYQSIHYIVDIYCIFGCVVEWINHCYRDCYRYCYCYYQSAAETATATTTSNKNTRIIVDLPVKSVVRTVASRFIIIIGHQSIRQ